jgi:hypothetical protein
MLSSEVSSETLGRETGIIRQPPATRFARSRVLSTLTKPLGERSPVAYSP